MKFGSSCEVLVLSPYPCILKASILIIKNYHYEFAASHGIIQRNANKITAAETRKNNERSVRRFFLAWLHHTSRFLQVTLSRMRISCHKHQINIFRTIRILWSMINRLDNRLRSRYRFLTNRSFAEHLFSHLGSQVCAHQNRYWNLQLSRDYVRYKLDTATLLLVKALRKVSRIRITITVSDNLELFVFHIIMTLP